MRRAYETDNGPGGMSWELQDGDTYLGSYPRNTDLAVFAPVEVYTYADWERNAGPDGEETDPLDTPALVIDLPDDGRVGACDLCGTGIYADADGNDDGVHLRSGSFCVQCAPQVTREVV